MCHLQGELHCSEGVVISAMIRASIVRVLSQHTQDVARALAREARRTEAKAESRRRRAKDRAEHKMAKHPKPSCMLKTRVDGEYRGGIFYLYKRNPGTALSFLFANVSVSCAQTCWPLWHFDRRIR